MIHIILVVRWCVMFLWNKWVVAKKYTQPSIQHKTFETFKNERTCAISILKHPTLFACLRVISLYVTRFEKRCLPRTQQQDTFSPSNDSCIHWLTIQTSIDAENALAAFAVACFWGLSDVHECSGRLLMAAYPLASRQPAVIHHTTGWWDWPWI